MRRKRLDRKKTFPLHFYFCVWIDKASLLNSLLCVASLRRQASLKQEIRETRSITRPVPLQHVLSTDSGNKADQELKKEIVVADTTVTTTA